MYKRQTDRIMTIVGSYQLQPGEVFELEARVDRYGTTSSSLDERGGKVHISQWIALLSKLQSISQYTREIYRSTIYGGTGVRLITYGDRIISHIKVSSAPIRVDINNWVKYIVSTERRLDERQFRDYTKLVNTISHVVRDIDRYSFELFEYASRIDLSKVISDGYTQYEIEIELLDKPSYSSIPKWIECCRKVATWMNGTNIYYNIPQLSGFRMYINGSLSTYLDPDQKLIIQLSNYIGLQQFAQVRHFTMADFQIGSVVGGDINYVVDYKTDGERRILAIGPCGIIIFYPPYYLNVVDVACGSIFDEFELTLLDGELVPKDKRNPDDTLNYCSSDILFVVADALIVKGVEVRGTSHKHRLLSAKTYIDLLFAERSDALPGGDQLTIQWKSTWKDSGWITSPDALFNNVADLLSKIDDKGYVNGVLTDGLIFTPDNMSYPSEEICGRTPAIIKWKPPHQVTIDFMIKLIDGAYTLWIDNRDKVNKDDNDRITEIEFVGNRRYPFDRSMIDTSKLKPEYDGYIGEFEWVNDLMSFKLLRYNKMTPNAGYAALSNWELMNNPLMSDTMAGLGNQQMRFYHNRVKESLLKNISPLPDSSPITGRVLLDLGSGKGGDVNKWSLYNIVIAVEPNSEYIVELRSRAIKADMMIIDNYMSESIPFDKKILIICQAFAQHTEKIETVVRTVLRNVSGNQQVDTISMMDSGTFFWKSKDILSAVCTTIRRLLSPGGLLIWKMMDGDAVRHRMGYFLGKGRRSEIAYGDFNIVWPNRNTRGKIYVTMPDSKTVQKEQKEYLTGVSDMIVLLNQGEQSFTEVFRKRADLTDNTIPAVTMGDDSLYISSLYHYGVIKRSGSLGERRESMTLHREIYTPQAPQVVRNVWDQPTVRPVTQSIPTVSSVSIPSGSLSRALSYTPYGK